MVIVLIKCCEALFSNYFGILCRKMQHSCNSVCKIDNSRWYRPWSSLFCGSIEKYKNIVAIPGCDCWGSRREGGAERYRQWVSKSETFTYFQG